MPFVNSEKELISILENKQNTTIWIHYETKYFPIHENYNLVALYCVDNILTFIPELNKVPNLEKLWIYCNRLKTISSLNKLSYLKGFCASHNKLVALPVLDSLFCLEWLVIIDNNLTALPEHIKTVNSKNTSQNKYPRWLNYKNLVENKN